LNALLVFLSLCADKQTAPLAGIIAAEMPEAVPRRLLDSASLKLYEATKMAQGYGYVPNQGYGYYGYYGPPPQGGRYPTARLPDLTITLPTTTFDVDVVLPIDEPVEEEPVKSAAESVKTETPTPTAIKSDPPVPIITTVNTMKSNSASSSVFSALSAVMAGLVYALAF
jgi:hypothetical protein